MLFLLLGCQHRPEQQELASNPTVTPLLELPSLSEFAGTPVAKVAPLPNLDQVMITQGKLIYDELCASCHGSKLEGEPEWQVQNDDNTFRAPPHNANGHTWHHSDKVLTEIIALGGARLPANIGGTSLMPAFSVVLTGAEIATVLTYIKSTWPEDIRTIQWEQSARDP